MNKLNFKFIGRELELEQLKFDFDDVVIKGKKCLSYLIQGRKDIGKTEIFKQFINNIENDIGLKSEIPKFNRLRNVISYKCSSDSDEAYAPFIFIRDEIEKRHKLLRILSSIFSVIMAVFGINDLVEALKKLFRDLRGKKITDEEIEKRKKIKEFNKYRKTLKRYSKKTPVIIFIQNVQFIDEYSLFLIERLVSDHKSFWGMIILEEDTSDQYDEKVQKSLTRMLNGGLMKSLGILSLENNFPSQLLVNEFGEDFFTQEENDTLFVISEGCPGKLIGFIDECIEEELLIQENSKWKKVDDFSHAIRPRFQKLLELIIQTLEDGIITDAELKLIKKFSKVWNIPTNTVNNTIAMLKDITKMNLNILGRLGPGIIGKISLLVSDKDDNRFIVEHFPLNVADTDIQVNRIDLNNNKFIWEAKEIKMGNEGIVILWDYIDGKKTRDELIAANELNLKNNVRKFIQILTGLSQLHNNNIPHFFIRPQSVIETDENRYKLVVINKDIFKYLDFEQSNLFSNRENINFMPPEQMENKRYDIRSDIFSIGVLFYKSLTGHFPFHGTKEVELINAIKRNHVDFDGNLMAHVPDEYQHIIRKCLSYNPDDRYQNAEELLGELPDIPKPSTVIYTSENLSEVIKEEIKQFPTSWDYEKIKNVIREKHRTIIGSENILNDLRPRKKPYSVLTIILVSLIFIVIALNSWCPIIGGYGCRTECIKPEIVTEIVSRNEFDKNEIVNSDKLNYLLNLFIQFNDKTGLRKSEFDKKYNSSESLCSPSKLLTAELGKNENGIIFSGIIDDNEDNQNSNFSFTFTEPTQLLDGTLNELLKKLRISNEKKISFTKDWDAFDAFYFAEKAWKKLDVTKAMQKYEEALSIDPNFALATLRLADVYRWKGKTDEAKQTLKKVSSRFGELSKLDSLNGRSLEARLKGDLRSAIRISKNIIDLKPNDKEPSYNVAELYYQLCDIERAIHYYQLSLKFDSTFSSSINHLAYCYTHLGQHRKALSLFKKYVKIDSSANAYDSWGDGYFAAAKLDSAEWAKEEGLKIDKDLSYLYSSLAFINIRQGKSKSANNNINKYINSPGTTNQTKANGLFIKSLNLFHQLKYKEALDTCLKAKMLFDSKDIVTRDHDMHWLLSQLYIVNNLEDKALDEANEMNELINENSIDETNYHKILKYKLHIEAILATNNNDLNRLNEIVNLFSTQLKTKIKDHGSPFGPAYFNTLFSQLYEKMGQTDKAEKLLEDALDYTIDYPMAHYYLWKLYGKLEKKNIAKNEKTKFKSLWSSADSENKSLFGINN